MTWSELRDPYREYPQETEPEYRAINAPHEGGQPTPPVYRIRILRTREWRMSQKAQKRIQYIPKTNTVVLDSDEDGSIEVIGKGSINVERRGAGAGDAMHMEGGTGNATRSGSGDGSAVRSGMAMGDAKRTGKGRGTAVIGKQSTGRATATRPTQALRVGPAKPTDMWSDHYRYGTKPPN